VQLNFEELRNLLVTLGQTDIGELTIKSADFELTVRKGVQVSSQGTAIESTVAGRSGVPSVDLAPPMISASTASPATPEARATAVDSGTVTSTPVSAATPSIDKSKWLDVTSPMVGTFYRAPAPDEPPFVDVGDRIRNGQAVCIIEAMKLMNELEAEVSGEVMEILVQNGEPVEYGQVLMRVNPG
jgi:acetyl-CoA carboxylase biotin carboxyl carrier protein